MQRRAQTCFVGTIAASNDAPRHLQALCELQPCPFRHACRPARHNFPHLPLAHALSRLSVGLPVPHLVPHPPHPPQHGAKLCLPCTCFKYRRRHPEACPAHRRSPNLGGDEVGGDEVLGPASGHQLAIAAQCGGTNGCTAHSSGTSMLACHPSRTALHDFREQRHRCGRRTTRRFRPAHPNARSQAHPGLVHAAAHALINPKVYKSECRSLIKC
mmetsp:Transcript_1686/g.2755  ORF Transcript_1686/g.2755 Transcript_1686/m.2755 type:complete len:214 (-) Transcript_1686:554-1195(-)